MPDSVCRQIWRTKRENKVNVLFALRIRGNFKKNDLFDFKATFGVKIQMVYCKKGTNESVFHMKFNI